MAAADDDDTKIAHDAAWPTPAFHVNQPLCTQASSAKPTCRCRSWQTAGRAPARCRCARAAARAQGWPGADARPRSRRSRRRARNRSSAACAAGSATRSRSRLTSAGGPAPAASSANAAQIAASSFGKPRAGRRPRARNCAATAPRSALVPTVHSGRRAGRVERGRRPARPARARDRRRAISASARRTPSASARLAVSRSPAMSTRITSRPPRSSATSRTSRVVPGSSLTIARSERASALSRRRFADIGRTGQRHAQPFADDAAAADALDRLAELGCERRSNSREYVRGQLLRHIAFIGKIEPRLDLGARIEQRLAPAGDPAPTGRRRAAPRPAGAAFRSRPRSDRRGPRPR